MNRLLTMHWALICFLGASLVGCSPGGPVVLGMAPTETPLPLADAQRLSEDQTVTLSGILIEKCPEAGCWFLLKDEGRTVKVDTKTAGFVVVDVPLNRQVTVVGRWVKDGNQRILAASGLRY